VKPRTTHSGEHREADTSRSLRRSPSFIGALIANVAGLVIVLGLALLIAMVWQGVASTDEAARQELGETLERATERLQILIRAAEMTAESAERAARTPEVTGATLRPMLEMSLAAFEQRPELSYLGIALPESGEYGTLERTATGEIRLWLFPGRRLRDPVTRNFVLTDRGFVPHEERTGYDYDPRERPFYQAALRGPASGTWIPTFQWIVHTAGSEPLWGFSYVKALRDGGGRLIGVLDADFDMPALNSFLQSLAAEYRARFQIVELETTPRLIGGSGVGRAPLPLPGELAPLLDASGDVFVQRMALEGERRWVAARRLELRGGVSWLVVASRTAPFIEAPLRRQLYQVVGMGAAIAVGLALVSARMTRRFGQPLAELERRVASIGRHDLPEISVATAVSAVSGFRETQLLGEALDRMAEAVNQLLEAKEQQTASLALKGAIFDSTNTAIFSLDHRLALIEWNGAAERLFGLEREQVLGQSAAETVFAPDGPADWAAILATTGTGAYRFAGAHGAFDAELRLITFNRNGGEVRTLFLNDVSERKRADAALRESLARFHAAARATGDVVWDWDLTGNVIWWNENFRLLFGYTADEIEPGIESWTRRVHPDDYERVIAHIYAVIAGNEEIWFDEYRFRRKDGSYADLFDRGHVLRDESNRGVRMVGAMQDITERKQAQARLVAFNAELEQRVADRTRELQSLNHELESFCYSVSHDLRAPLRAIAGFAEILVRNYTDTLDDKARDYLGRVLTATQRMGELIDDLLQLSRVSREEMRRETVDLSAIARDVLADLGHAEPERRVDALVEDGLSTTGDTRLLRIVLENLLGNAWKFTSKTPAARIAFTASHKDGTPGFAVSDNGAGFDMRYAGKLFSPFQRLHRTTEFPGTGIGLATVQRIVIRHGGHISVRAEPGKGATFHFSF
jgi:PAS domain S-box-containing protein